MKSRVGAMSPRRAVTAGILSWLGALMVEAQLISRRTSVWGEISPNETQSAIGGTELLTALLMTQVGLGLAFFALLFRAWRRVQQARATEGSEVLALFDRSAADQRVLERLVYGLLPWVTVALFFLGGRRPLWGVPLADIVLSLFWLDTVLAAGVFLMCEAGRRALGSPRLRP